MKNAILMSVVALGLVACASNKTETQPAPQPAAPVRNFQPTRACGLRAPQPAPAPKQECNTCSKSYTVSEPVEVVYKNVTYTTVYEPKTYSNTTYVKKPYSCKEAGNCEQIHAVPAPVPAPAPVVVNE